jgi:hypothetical protein
MKKISIILAILIIFFTLTSSYGRGQGAPIPIHQCNSGYTAIVPYFCVANVVFSNSSFATDTSPSRCDAVNLSTLWNIPKDAKLISFPYTWAVSSGAVGADGVFATNANFYQNNTCTVLLPGSITSAVGFINSIVTNVNSVSGNSQLFAGSQSEITILLNGNTTIYIKQYGTALLGCGTCNASVTIFQPIFYTTN